MTKGNAEPEHEFFDACATLLDAYEELVPMLEYAVFDFKLRFIDFARDASRKRRDDTSVLTYDGLLNAVYEPLRAAGPSSVRDDIIKKVSEAYPLAFIDEFQDTDSVQYGIFRAIYGDGAAIYVGDPKQAIYSFRGADVYSYIDAASDVGPRKHSLKMNRRSDPGVVQAINGLYGFRANAFLIEDIQFKPALAHEPESRTSLQPPMEVVFVPEDELKGSLAPTVAPIVANEIALLLGSGAEIEGRSVRPGDVAVLCRSNNQANAVTNALRSLNVPTALDGGSSVLETAVATDLQAVLEAALMPGDSRLIRRALLTTLLGVLAVRAVVHGRTRSGPNGLHGFDIGTSSGKPLVFCALWKRCCGARRRNRVSPIRPKLVGIFPTFCISKSSCCGASESRRRTPLR